ncbi:PREDICTED: CASP-like protein 2D1 [Nicotiana attenuata]|uniref:CASP-like protein n=1 Tax=Nicotiana attenuata TaxID=49451 RepID=A0A1J6IUD6_NICAT|nr:PREDICTED: CASP-like protein 2D1 [Nicotiana attenuata]OIT08346.1 casp-like protein 2d1 [Nicotiana attenuata]
MGFLGHDASNLKVLDCLLRLFVIPLSVASIWLSVSNQQDNSSYGRIEFSNISGLKYMVGISAASGGYALLTAISLWVRSLVTKAWFFFLSDQIVAYLMVTSLAALTEILYLAYNGDQKVTWSEACSSYGKFCSRLKLVLVLHSITFCCFLVLAVISAYRLFSRFQPPLVPSKENEEENETRK